MAEWFDGTDSRQRWALFLQTQAPVSASVVLLLVLVAVLGVDVYHPLWLVVGAGPVVASTVLALTVRWERLPSIAHAGLPLLDLLGVGILATALYGAIDTVSALALFPALWLSAAFGWRGVILGVAGAYAAALAPLLITPGERSTLEWASALVLPVVIAVLAAAAQRVASTVRATLSARDAAASESDRAGAALRSFFERVDAGLLYLDDQGDALLFNTAITSFGRLARHGDGDRGGSRVYAADQVTPLAPEDQPLEMVRRGQEFADFLYWVGPRGGQRALLATGRQVRRADGRVSGSILVVQDVTELLRAQRSREDGLATLAHELRTPLTSIVGYTDLLLMGELSEEASARVEVISRNADHLLDLIAVFLDDLHRADDPVLDRIAVRTFVDDALEVLDATPEFAEREVHVDVGDDLTVLADRSAMASVLINLLGNAAKFSGPGDRITVAAEEDAAWVSIVVSNTGSRVDPEDLERIFDRFYRGGNAQRAAVAGTGIGLSVGRQIVAAHGGTLTADDVDDAASFRICLPRD